MDDLISRQSAIDALGEAPEVWTDSPEEFAALNQWEMDVTAIEAVPSADRPSGEWVYHKDNMPCVRWDRWECDQCHNRTEYVSDYCPNCGADMRGGTE